MKNRRKIPSNLVNKEFQGKLLLIFAIFSFTQWFISYFAIWYSFERIGNLASQISPAVGRELLAVVSAQQFYLVAFTACAFLLALLFFTFILLRFSHRAAGAIYRFTKEFDEMKKNKKLHKLETRETDFFKPLEVSFNSFVDSMTIKED